MTASLLADRRQACCSMLQLHISLELANPYRGWAHFRKIRTRVPKYSKFLLHSITSPSLKKTSLTSLICLLVSSIYLTAPILGQSPNPFNSRASGTTAPGVLVTYLRRNSPKSSASQLSAVLATPTAARKITPMPGGLQGEQARRHVGALLQQGNLHLERWRHPRGELPCWSTLVGRFCSPRVNFFSCA